MLFCSVIIPNYNHEKYLRARIESVLHQTLKPFEIILLDDASTDNSREILLHYKNHPLVSQVILNETNSGSPFRQWQKGLSLAKAPWVWIAESDDYADPNFLKTAYDFVTNNEIQLFYSDAYFVDGNNIHSGRASAAKSNFFNTKKWNQDYITEGITDLNQYLKFRCIVNNASAMVVQKELAQKIIESSTAYKYYGDWVFYINAFLSARVGYSHQPLCFYRTHADNHVNPDTAITKTKHEYLKILQHLLSLKQVTEPNAVITFFSKTYMGFGFVKEGLINGLMVFRQYVRMDKKLGWLLIRKFLYYRFLQSRKKTAGTI